MCGTEDHTTKLLKALSLFSYPTSSSASNSSRLSVAVSSNELSDILKLFLAFLLSIIAGAPTTSLNAELITGSSRHSFASLFKNGRKL